MIRLLETLAQTSNPSTQPAGQPAPFWVDLFFKNPMGLVLIALAVMWIFMLRSKKSQDAQRKDMLSQLKRGDRIQTIGGILGTVVEAREDEVVVKVDESSNTKLRFTRSAIHRVVESEKAPTK